MILKNVLNKIIFLIIENYLFINLLLEFINLIININVEIFLAYYFYFYNMNEFQNLLNR